MSSSLQTVHVRVNDAATGRPTPVRIRFTDAEENYHAPFGRLTNFSTTRNQDVGGNVRLGNKNFAYIDGTCEIALPPGTIHVEIHKGPEYVPVQETVSLPEGKLSLRLSIERWIDARKDGWYSGDCRSHFVSPSAALLEGEAEGLAVVQVLAREIEMTDASGAKHTAIPNILAFSGHAPALSTPSCLVAVNTLNSHPVLGSLGLLHCHRVVFPLTFGGPDGKEDWTLADWCDQCHRKNGLVVWARTARESADFAFGEPLADLVLGKIDAFELASSSALDNTIQNWYDLLNAGLQVPLAGSSGKESNASELGAMRTYARLLFGEELSCKTWIEAVRAGRTFVTNGPLLFLEVNGSGPGTTVLLPPAADKVRVKVQAQSVTPFDRLELVRNGDVIADASPSRERNMTMLEADIPASESYWLAARCRGDGELLAQTSAVRVQVPGRPFRVRESALGRFIAELTRLREWATTRARCDDERQRDRLVAVFRHALEVLEKCGQCG